MFRSSPSSLAAIAAACLLTVALPAGTAMAQKSKGKTKGEAAPAAEIMPEVVVDIPEIITSDSNVDEDTLRAIFSGNLADNADALAELDAGSIDIPTVSVDVTVTVEGETSSSNITLNDIALKDVSDGVAATVVISGFEMSSSEDGSGNFGAMAASDFNIAALLGFYGLVDGGGTSDYQKLYSDFSFDGGSISSPEGDCTIGEITGGKVLARPLSYSMSDFFSLVQQLDEESEEPSPEVVAQAMGLYAELLTAVQSDPISFGGFDCSFEADDGQVTMTIASAAAEGFEPGIYPEVSIDGIDMIVAGEGQISIGNVTIKSSDLNGISEALAGAPASVDATWFEENARLLIPEFGGFSVSDVSVDIPDAEDPDASIVASIGAFDLTLSEYRNGIPASISTSLDNLLFDLPATSDDESVQQLLAYGIDSIDAGFNIDLAWNETDNTIAVTDISASAADLGSIAIAGTLINATEDLFDLDLDRALAAAMALAVSNMTLVLEDQGLSEIIVSQAAIEQGSTPEQLRSVFADLAQGTIIGQLATAANAQEVGKAVRDFVQGTATMLSISVTAKDPEGIGLPAFLAASENPVALVNHVDVTAEAN